VLFGRSGTPRLFYRAVEVARSRRRVARAARLALSATVAVSVLGLVVFHAALFWNQVADGRLLDPATATRWVVGALMFGAMLALRRAGVPVLWGRRALVAWMLVALLHWTAAPATDPAGVADAGAQTTQVLVDLPIGAAGILAAVSLSLLLLLDAGLTPPVVPAFAAAPRVCGPSRASLLSRHLASRAPPAVRA
jgi:hypothetical protein